MLKSPPILTLFILAALHVDQADAGELSYRCAVRNTYFLSDAGGLTPMGFPKNWNFEVSRKTGEMTGGLLPMHQSDLTIKVLYRGSSGMAFKSTATWGGRFVQSANLVIQEFANGLDKPFLFSGSGAQLITGVCR